MFAFRRDPFGDLMTEFGRVSDEVNRLFGHRHGAEVTGPALNVRNDEHHVYVEVDLPAIDLAKLEVSVAEGNQLSISAERTQPEIPGAVWVRNERPCGTFSRTLTLPVLVDADRVEATYEQGVLKLVLPKSEAAKPRKIAVKA